MIASGISFFLESEENYFVTCFFFVLSFFLFFLKMVLCGGKGRSFFFESLRGD
jgi:hypothetical protein